MTDSKDQLPSQRAIAAVYRVEAPCLVGALLRYVRDLEVAEDLAQDALLVALEKWPKIGVPDNPGAWLMTTAKHRAIDYLRRRRMQLDKHAALQSEFEGTPPSTSDVAESMGDDVLRLIFMACHPVLSADARIALALRLLGGLSTPEVARAFLVAEPTMAQRIVRAKRTLKEARVPCELPAGSELTRRLPAVLEVIYLIFNEGYSASAGENPMRPDLCHDALRLGRSLAARLPNEGEVHGLVALMELHASRMRCRRDAAGQPILLYDQQRARWDQLLIRRGLTALERAEARAHPLGPYTLQAAISACHARATRAEATDWPRIVALYDALVELTGSPVVELNRAVAVSMAFGPAQALPLVDELAELPTFRRYHLLPSVRADLLMKLGRFAEAETEFQRAAGLASNPHDQRQLRLLADRCKDQS